MQGRAVGTAIACLLLAGCLPKAPAPGEGSRQARIIPCRRAAGKIAIDGKLNDPAWDRAYVLDDFRIPPEGRKPRHPSSAQLLWDDEFLYLGVVMEDFDLLALKKERDAASRDRLAALERELTAARKGWVQDRLAREIGELREEIAHLGQDLEQRAARIESAARFSWGDDLGGDEETILSRLFDRPVMVTRYPRGVKAFYMKPAPDDPRVVLNVDVLAPEGYGEIIGGSQREDRLDALLERMREEQLDPAAYDWYLDLRRYGTVPHGGFGLGLERFIAWICGLRHIREAIPFPRMMGRCYP